MQSGGDKQQCSEVEVTPCSPLHPSSGSITSTTVPSTTVPSTTVPFTTVTTPTVYSSILLPCNPPSLQGDNSIVISIYGLVAASVIFLLLILIIAILIVLLWRSRRKRAHKHSHNSEIKTGTITAHDSNDPPEVSAVAYMPLSPSSVPQPPGESGDITTTVNVAYESSDIATSVNPAYQPLQTSSDNTLEYDNFV